MYAREGALGDIAYHHTKLSRVKQQGKGSLLA